MTCCTMSRRFAPQFIVLPDRTAAASVAARLVLDTVEHQPRCVLGLATGETMCPVYDAIAQGMQARRLSFAGATSFNLDTYVGLAPDHPASFVTVMAQHLFSRIDLPADQRHLPDGMAQDIAASAARYETAIAEAGGIDLQLLGIGRNGHIAFNEPGSPFVSRTRVVELTPTSREPLRSLFAPSEPPTHGLTVGIATILAARRIVLVAFGAAKASPLASAFRGPPDESLPASALQLHPDVTVICDEAAAAGW